jgi:multisubunit Na+/H+ antiporter MnhE subunit
MAVRGVLPGVAWFVAFFWMWMFLVADWNRIEWIAGALVAAVAATLTEVVRRAMRVRLELAPGVLRQSALVLPMVFVDFAILVRALARRPTVHGRYVMRDIDPGPKTTPAGVARRAWTVLLAGYSPNAYVVDIDPETRRVVLHDLVPHRRSEERA